MSALTLQLPATYSYVLLAATASCFTNFFHGVNTSMARKAAKVPYPACYASEEAAAKDPLKFKFNCAQRSHANFLEAQPSFLVELLVSGLRYPVASACLGTVWAFSRVLYGVGYTQKGPTGRRSGFMIAILCDMALKCMALYTSVAFSMGL